MYINEDSLSLVNNKQVMNGYYKSRRIKSNKDSVYKLEVNIKESKLALYKN
jgi:hypothetical protein